MKTTRTVDKIRAHPAWSLFAAIVLAVGIFVPAAVYAGGPASPASPAPQPMRYVALGDSVAAGAGLSTGNNDNDNVCDRSYRSYPYMIAESLGASLEHYACTGAKVDEGLYSSQIREDTQLFPQLDRAFFYGTPNVITMTVGANDVRWTELIQACYVADCESTVDTYAMTVLRADLRLELAYALREVQSKSEGAAIPRVLMSGYYLPFSDDISCVSNDQITVSELAWLREQHGLLNQAIQDISSSYSFAEFVPIDFTGHEICSDNPWVQTLSSSAPLHPTREGQRVIGRAFIAQL